MEQKQVFIINGGKRLSGEVAIRGAKNGGLKLMAASLLFEHPVRFTNVPDIADITTMQKLLESIGVMTTKTGDALSIDARKLNATHPSNELVKRMRASIIIIGPLLARLKKARIVYPGGCVIGKRPIDFFINGFKTLGAEVRETNKLTREIYSFSLKENRGGEIFLPFPSVTATETFIMAAALASGKTIIKNAACEPEIVSLAEFLQKGGARIEGAGTNTITIEGTHGKLLALKKKNSIPVIPDRIETGSFAILASLLGDPLRINNCNPNHIESLLLILEAAGASIKKGDTWLEIKAPEKLTAVDITTGPYPNLATDLQAPLSVLLTQSHGRSLIFETIWEGRLNYLEELKRMGANVIVCDPHRAIIEGPTQLEGKKMESPDLRAGLAFVIAGLVAKGTSVIHNVYHIDRGYERIEERLKAVGADIRRADESILRADDNLKL